MCGITMETRSKGYIHIIQMFQFHTPVYVYMQDYNEGMHETTCGIKGVLSSGSIRP